MKGNIFNIQKFSIHDGPGIRTTVFLKGCPLRCKWCSNPESQESDIQVSYDSRKCIRCGTCARSCPQQCISDDIVIDHARCTGCLTCVHSCPAKAMKAEGEMMEPDQVLKICLQDLDFYQESGGGVTLSGGECFCQNDFCEDLIRLLHGQNIPVAAETTGYVPEEVFCSLAPMFDLLLFDVKHYDPQKHFAGTGVRNELILRNLEWAFSRNLPVLPRIPVIPGFNSQIADARGIAAMLNKIGLKKVQLLPFHQFGERKYELLGREYSLKGEKALHPEDLQEYRRVFEENLIECIF